MILLIDKACKFCQQVDELDKQYSDINKFYVENGMADINGEKHPLDPKISMLPCLIDGINYYMTVDPILEYLQKTRRK